MLQGISKEQFPPQEEKIEDGNLYRIGFLNSERMKCQLCGLIKLLAFRTSGLDLEAIADLYPMEILRERRN